MLSLYVLHWGQDIEEVTQIVTVTGLDSVTSSVGGAQGTGKTISTGSAGATTGARARGKSRGVSGAGSSKGISGAGRTF